MVPRIRTTALLVTLALLFAGCVGAEDEDPAPGAPTTNTASGGSLAGPNVPPDEAAVTGRVVSASLDPLVNVTIVVQGSDTSGVTDAQGRYLIEHLEPGEHKIFAQAPGYALNLRAFTLEAGALSVLNFIMEEVAGEDPYTTVLDQNGFLECQVGIPMVGAANCVPIQNLLDDLGMNPTNTVQILKWELERAGLKAVIVEAVWEPPIDGTGENLWLLFERDSTDLVEGGTFGSETGPSPLRIELLGEDVDPIVDANATQYQTRIFPAPELGEAVFQQKFTIFISLFHYSLPLPGYTAIPDGYVP